eukprot:scaffold282185_cov39-Prasinocladus_malaysianus.AAC.1
MLSGRLATRPRFLTMAVLAASESPLAMSSACQRFTLGSSGGIRVLPVRARVAISTARFTRS